MTRQIEDVIQDLNKPENNFNLVCMVAESASQYFVGFELDFCIQIMSGDCIVFGGYNRLRWTPQRGFIALRSYCSDKFLEQYDRITTA